LFDKHGLKVNLQQLNPQSSLPAVISESADRSVAARRDLAQ
jgi:hypothetical protein